MTDDVRISVGLRRHRKTKRLKKLLGADGCWALVCLFLWAGEERWTGDLSGLTDDDIETEADWDGEPGAFVAALIEIRFLAGDAGARSIHDWQEHNPYASTKGQRIEKGKRAANARWSKDAPSMPDACNEDAGTKPKQCPPAPAPAPAPTPTNPEQEQKPERASPSGSRLPVDWVLPDDYRAWCEAKHPEIDPDGEAEKFADHWHAKAGKDARKTDWLATWRNWLRTDFPKAMKARAGPSVQAGPASKTRSAIGKLQALKLPETPYDPDMAAQRTAGRPEQAALPAPR